MFYKSKISSIIAVVALIVGSLSVSAFAATPSDPKNSTDVDRFRITRPLNLAVLIQDDLVSHVGNELGVTRDFIRALPNGSRVMVGYITSGSLQVRQPFTNDLDKASRSLRIPISSASSSPYNPYVEVLEALKRFDSQDGNRNVLLVVSDGLDVSRGLDASSILYSIDLDRAIREAKRLGIPVYSFYAPTVGLSIHNSLFASYGQSALARLSKETGGKAFFQGTRDFVTFDPYFTQLSVALNRRY
jgi:hypothetical protein